MRARRVWSGGSLPDIFQERIEEATSLIWCQEEDAVTNQPDQFIDEIVAHLSFTPIDYDVSKIVRTPIKTAMYTELGGGGINRVPGQVFTASIPFTGSTELLEYDASEPGREGTDSRIKVAGQVVEMEIGSAGPRLNESMIDEQIEEFKSKLAIFARRANAAATEYNKGLRTTVRRTVLERKQLLDDTTRLDAALSIPISVVDIESQIAIPVTRTLLRLEEYLSAPPEQQYHLSGEIYDNVLRLITTFGRAMERLPITARQHDEPFIRDTILFVLNANYQGAASGEVFHGSGKTDILLNYKDKTAFIAELKFWDGPKSVTDAVDQLCRYTVWRDTKATLVLLIKDVRPTTAINGADQAIRGHPQFSGALDSPEPDARRDYILTSNTDPDRKIALALLYVVIPDPVSKYFSGG